ncbi:Like-Sm (LSM) domain containing protein, LSm4/SmD1/SmD3 [Phytophthora cactorum]|nr:Like-Sm (LSM) domain containing protein, LSm4/SmD1/SmD3 [Phytophthora cactorum]
MATHTQDAPATGGQTATPSSRQLTPTSDSNTPMRGPAENTKSVEQPPPSGPTAKLRCVLCGLEASSAIRLVRCNNCGSNFHAHCANLPQPPEEGNLFCRHSCYATFKQQQSKAPFSDTIQSVLQEKSDRLQRAPVDVAAAVDVEEEGVVAEGEVEAGDEDTDDEVSHRHPRLSSIDGDREQGTPTANDGDPYTPLSTTGMSYPTDQRPDAMAALGSNSNSNTPRHEDEERNLQPSSRTASPASRRPLRGFDTEQDSHFRSGAPPNLPPSSSSMQMSRQPRGEYSSMPAPDQPGADGSRPRHGFSSPQYPIAGSRHAQEDPRSLQAVQPYFDGRSSGQMPPTQAGPNQRIPPGMQPPQQPMQDERAPLQRDFETPYRGAPAGPTPPPVPFNDSQRGDLPSGTRNGPPPPNFNGASSNNYDPQGQFPAQPPSQLPIRRHTPNIPWRNPSAFPAEIYERFSCHSDDANHVFRIDLSPVFAEKATKLYQNEIDFFFRCFESPDVSLVVKGMSSELNQYIWAWPFILECCGNDTHFAFDHFQFKRNTETDMPELAYVGELQLSMASFNSYLEKYLSNVPGKDVVVLEDHVTKKTITIVASENIIALNNLVLASIARRSAGFAFSTVLLQDGEFVHVNKGRQHFWRVVEKDSVTGSINAPCVFLSWEWVYQGVSQRGISTECWFAMKNASMCPDGWVFDPRRAIVEAAKCGVAIVRTGQFLRSALASGRPRTSQMLSFTAAPAPVDRGVVAQRQAQMVLFLESILPCLDAIVEEAYELGLSSTDDSDEFRKVFDDESMWRTVDADLRDPPADNADNYSCGICEREITNLYNSAWPEQHHFKPRAIASYYDKVLSSEGHTGILPATRRYQSVRSYFKCRCVPSNRCAHCGGCESCSCLCHTLYQTRFRFTAPGT